jgi:hypothetical protein
MALGVVSRTRRIATKCALIPKIVDAVARVEQATHASYRDRNISQVRYFT